MVRNRERAPAKKSGGKRRGGGPRLAVEQLESRILPAHPFAPLLLAPPEVVNLHLARALPPGVHHAAHLAHQGPALAVPGLPGQTVRTHFTRTARNTPFNNEVGLFLVDDAYGHIGKLQPGQRGYAAAALSRSRSRVLFARGQTAGASRVLDLPSDRFFGVYLIPNGTTAAFRAHNPRNRLAGRPTALFSFTRANPDGRDHLHWLSGHTFAWSDGGGSPPDFGNLTARVEFGKPRGIPLAALPAPVVAVPAPTVAPAQHPSAPDAFLLTPVPEDAALALHIHPHLTIFIDGQAQVIPADIGVGPEGALPIHTHDTSGTLHIESPVNRDFRLQDFFTIWGQTAAGRDLLARLTDPARQLAMTINGQPSTAFGSLVLHDGDNIVLRAAIPGPVVAPAAPRFDLSVTSHSGSADEHSTAFGRVTLVGQTDPNVNVVLVETGAQAIASRTGLFQFPNVPLVLGDNPFTARATNQAGGSADFRLTIHRVEQPSQTNAVLTWNHVLLEAVRLDNSPPPVASRALAMVQGAVLDAVNALDGTPARFVTLTAPAGTSVDAAVAAAAHRVLSYLYPAQQASFDQSLATSLGPVADGPSKTDGIALGQAAGDALIALRAHDGFDQFVDYAPGSGPGVWQPTPPMYAEALLPQWATLQPFAMTSPDQFRPPGPPDLTSQAWADAFNDVKSLGSAESTVRTADQTQIARFWADGAGSYTPPGHWNQIAAQIAQQQDASLAEDARLFAALDVSMADAAIIAWDAKYDSNTWRPVTAIQAADSAGNSLVQADPHWSSFLITPNFPEYVSGHSTFSAAAATVLDAFFGPSVSFSTTSVTLPGVTRTFAGFAEAATEAGRSRVYGGIHFEFANQDGQAAGRALAQYVLGTFEVSSDTQPPQVLLTSPAAGVATATQMTVQGRVLDNLSGVAQLEVQLDTGDIGPVPFDQRGNFSYPTTLPLDGSADGPHIVNLRATDAAGNVAAAIELAFTLDTRAPQIVLDGPTDGGEIGAGAELSGTADGTGSAITRLTYRLDSGTVMPIAFDPTTGQFTQALDLSRLAAGQHTLAVTARDAAGHETAVSLTVSLAAAVPFTITSFTPRDGAVDVGSTFRPQVFFSRPIDPASLSPNNFFATDPSGAKLSARIVPAGDGSFAWLFFTNPMPGASRIMVHVDGSTLRAAADGVLLDADGDGTPGGLFQATFTTVSLTPLLGTSLSGKVVDPGPDLAPMTFDDIRAGADQVLHTSDDVFLRPLAGVKVFILGLEDQVVLTDAAGNFHFDTVPAGNVKLALDGRTVTNAPAGFYFPEMVMDLDLVAGQANTVMGTMGTPEEQKANRDRQEVYLPRLQTSLLHDVSGTAATMLGVDAVSAPDLTPRQRSLLTLEVQPGSLIDQDGNPMATGQVGISTVPPELVRDMLPPGVLQHTFDITIQAPGVATFATPAPITFPNVFNAAPGTKLNFLSFDHTTGRLVIDGTATVSADGLSVRTDPGNGITHPGWHGLPPPGGPGGPGGGGPPPPDEPDTCDLPAAPAAAGAGGFAPLKSCPLPTTMTLPAVALPLITGETGSLSDPGLAFTAPAAGTAKNLTVKIEIDGPLTKVDGSLAFMKKLVAFSPKVQILSLKNQTFTLTAGSGQTKTLEGTAKTYEELFGNGKGKKGAFSNAGFAALDRDQLYGARIQVTRTLLGTDGSKDTTIQAFYLYRFVNATKADDAKNHVGDTVAFQKTLVDSGGGLATTKVLAGNLPKKFDTTFRPKMPGDEDNPFLQKMNNPAKSAGNIFWQFDPIHTGLLEGSIDIVANNPQDGKVTVGTLKAEGTGAAKFEVNLNLPGFKAELARVINSLQVAWTPGPDQFPGFHPPGTTRKATSADEDHYGFVTAAGKPSDDSQQPLYVFGATSGNPAVVHTVTTVRANGSTTPRDVLSFAPGASWGALPGKDGMLGTPDDLQYARFIVASPQFQKEFKDFMPDKRPFNPAQQTALENKTADVAAQLKKAILDIYKPIIGTTGAIEFGDDVPTANRTVLWTDTFTAPPGLTLPPSNPDNTGPGGTGAPQMGSMQGSRDQAAQEAILGDKAVPIAAKLWELAETLNVKPILSGWFSVAAHIAFTNPTINFAAFLADTVAHEVGHSFGLLDAYNQDNHFPGTAMCVPVYPGAPVGTCIPGDIMRGGGYNDPALKFEGANPVLLKASLGLDPGAIVNGSKVSIPLKKGLRQYQQTFNLDKSSVGIVPDLRAAPVVPFGQTEGTVPTSLSITLITGDQQFFGAAGEDSIDFGPVVADGPGGAAGDVTFQVENDGFGPLTVSKVSFAKGDQGFSVTDAAALLGTPLAPGESRTLTVHFDPTVASAAHDTLILTSDADMMPMLLVSLTGDAFTQAPFAQVDVVGNNNLGGVTVGGDTASTPEIFQITNAGLDPLQITGVVLPEGNGAFRLLGVPANLATQPIVLARGESFTFGARFDPDHVGLARAKIDVQTNDPANPTLHLGVTGTGLDTVVKGKWGNDYVSLDTPDLAGSAALRARSDDKGNFEFFLPPTTSYDLSVFDPSTGLIGLETGTTATSGQRTELASTLVFQASTAPDTDFDGLPDDLEHAIGTSIRHADTDGNGLDDFAEIQQGLDPFGGRPIATGILSQLPLSGEAKQVVVEGATATNQAELAYLATGSFGLAIVDVSQFAKPVLLSELDLPGDATDVAVDALAGLAAVATGASGLQVIDVSNPAAPKLLRTIDVSVSQVEVSNGIAYVGVGDLIKSYDLRLGIELDKMYLGAPVGGLAREGGFLYATASTNVLTTIDISGLFFKRRGSLALPVGFEHQGPLFVGGGTAYVMNVRDDQYFTSGGFSTVDVSKPDLPRLISPSDLPAIRARQPAAGVAANGSGLAVLVGAPFLGFGQVVRSPRLELLDLSDPRDTYKVVGTTLLPSAPAAVTTAGGAAFVANGTSGLVIVNYLPFDVEGQPPVVSILPDPLSRDGSRSVTEGSAIRLPIQVRDDVQVRSVELLVADYIKFVETENAFTLARSDVSFPFDVEIPAPPIRPEDSLLRPVLTRVRVTDTGGNVTLSAPVIVGVTRDPYPPVYFPRSFVDGSVRTVGLTELSLFFSEPLARNTVTDQNFKLLDAQDQVVAGFSVQAVGNDAAVHLQFDGLAAGAYRLVIDAPNVKDRGGLPLGSTPIVTRFSVAQGTENHWVGDLQGTPRGNWQSPVNWSLGRVPGPTDVVRIAIADDKAISFFDAGVVAVRSLVVSSGTLAIVSGTLTVNEASQVDRLTIAQMFGGMTARLEGAGDVTITKSFKLAGGVLSGTGELRIAPGATGELAGNAYTYIDARPIIVEGTLNGVGTGVQYYRSPVIEIRGGGSFSAANGFRMTSYDGAVGRLDLFGRFTTEDGASIVFGPEIVVMPGGEFAPQAGRLELQGGGQFNSPLNVNPDTVLHLRGPTGSYAAVIPNYVFSAGTTHQVDGPLLIGSARVVVRGDTRVRLLDFASDFSPLGAQGPDGVVVIDGTMTVTEQLGGIPRSVFGSYDDPKGGSFEGTGTLVIEPQARYKARGQKFRGVTIINRGILDLSVGGSGAFGLGKDSVFEHEGTIEGRDAGGGSFTYTPIQPASFPSSVDQPFDRGTFNARVPLEFKDSMRFFVVLNAFAGINLINQTGRIFSFELDAGGTLHGPINVARGVEFNLYDPFGGGTNDPRRFSNVYTFAADSQIQIDGDLRVSSSSLIVNANVTTGGFGFSASQLDANGFGIYSNTISGPGNIDVTRQMTWASGRIAITGVVTVKPTASFTSIGSYFDTVLEGTTLIHQGTSGEAGGQITLAGGALWRNEGTLYRQESVAHNVLSGVGGGRIENYGSWVFFGSLNDFGQGGVDVPFFNYGTLRVDTLAFHDGMRFNDLDNNGTLIIGPHLFKTRGDLIGIKSFVVRGDYRQAPTATLRVEVQNTLLLGTQFSSDTQFSSGTLNVAGQAFLAGNLEVDFVQIVGPGTTQYTDRPAVGESYPLLTFGSRTGDFAQKTDVDLTDGVTYDFAYAASGIDAVVIADPAPLRAASASLVMQPSIEPTPAHLALALNAAIDRWAAAGVGNGALDRMRSANVQHADLGGDLLGLTAGNVITLDDDAGGWGWFVDPTPLKDEEFTPSAVDRVFAALGDGPAAGRMDLLTVVMHELGHIAGLDDLDATGGPEQLMTGLLATGVRRLP
jgi:hypothetical protein